MSDIQHQPRSGHWPTVLVVHNKYQQPGGEDAVVSAEIDLLRSTGARVETLIYDSGDDGQLRRLKRRPDHLIFNRRVYDEARALVRQRGIQIVHCHNLVPLLSTSIYSAATAEGIPTVQTIHNYRIGCLNGIHLRDGAICELCRPGHHLAGIAFGCYRGSHAQSLAFGLAQTINSWRGAWRQPTIYITPSNFLRDRLIEWHIPADQIVVKPHFVPSDPGRRSSQGQYALFVGRLSAEKGLDLLLDVWSQDRLRLVIVGDGPLREHLERRVRNEGLGNVRFAGQQDRDGVNTLFQSAQFLVLPSLVYETFGLTLIEAYAHGVPVIATRLGGLVDVVDDGVTGRLFEANDRADLSAKLSEMETDPSKIVAMSAAARHKYETSYSAQSNAEQLRTIYDRVLEQHIAL